MRGKRAKEIRHEAEELGDRLGKLMVSDSNKSQKEKARVLYRRCKKAWMKHKVMPSQMIAMLEDVQ